MAIYRKLENGNWYFSVYVPGRKTRLRGTCGTKNRSEALLVEQTMRLAASRKSPKDHIIKIIEALYGESEGEHDPVSLDAIWPESERIRRMRGRELGENTRRKVELHVMGFVRWVRAARPKLADIREIDRAVAQAYAGHLERAGKSAKTRGNIVAELGAAWNEIRHAHDRVENPWPLAMPAKRGGKRGEAFTPEEARRIFEAGDKGGAGWGLAARIAAATGLREGDVLRLRHEDIINGAIRLRPRKTERYGIVTTLPLPQDILKRIGSGTGPVFPLLLAEYAECSVMRHSFGDVLDAAGVDRRKYTFHSFRHFFRTRLAAAGVSDETAMRLGGWTQRETAARYDHDDHRAESADAIARAWMLTAQT